MKRIFKTMISIFLFLFSTQPSFAQESTENITPIEVSVWQILLGVLAPIVLLVIGYIMIKKMKI